MNIKIKFIMSLLISFFAWNSSYASSVETIFEVNNPQDVVNVAGMPLQMICGIRTGSTHAHYVTIYILNGRGVFNGTSFKKGDTMTSALNNMQQVAMSFDAFTQARITNTGPTSLKVLCEY